MQEEGRLDEASQQWHLALDEQPNFQPALFGLAEVAITQRDWPAFDSLVTRLRSIPELGGEVLTLTARKHLALREFAPALDAVNQAIAANPQAVWPRVVLTHILLQQANDWNAAERALRDVLALDPNHAEAQRNLDVLLRSQRGD